MTPNPNAPIGIFDSGVGGLTVARAIADQMPGERLRYVGDTANSPYGPKSIAEVRRSALAVADTLVASGVKMLVIACNTASAACLQDARERYDVPVVEVVRPAVRRAVATTRNGRIGVIGTVGTVRSRAYEDAFAAARDIEVTSVACPRFAEFVERGITSGRQVLGLAQGYLEPLHRADVDTVILGCTHYPMLTGVLQVVLGPGVTLVSSAEETAKDVFRLLVEHDMLADSGGNGENGENGENGTGEPAAPAHEFTSTGPAEPFVRLARRFLGPELLSVTSGTDGVVPVMPPSPV
ncbi:glutamate racemase [Streptoalloteichus hindustanus]|uniref:Glutamate racemase n=1 Tax=Streptoalloteichus hindustanus TaxID=2017 RepID=A0A1M5JHM7_STRHI|nr:glutamate racemase [Streptoalloteichus hindustanus]SHG40018.1 glutamate racemase [Streptoalloteichus hindustanus]